LDRARYRWNGHILYVHSVFGKWAVAYDGPCGKDMMYMSNAELAPSESKDDMQRRLNRWAGANGLERADLR
jgi:hypothetical protein